MRIAWKCFIACVLLFGWSLSSGLLSIKLDVANGPVRTVGHHIYAKSILKVDSVGHSLLKQDVTDMDVTKYVKGAQIIVPNARALQILILAISLVVVLAAGLCTGQPSPELAPVDLDDLEMGHHCDLEAPLDLEIGLGVVPPASTDNARSDLDAPVDAALGSVPPPGIVPSFLLPAEIMQLREQRRFMTQWAWTETFEQAYLGTVDEGEMLAGGFGGTVRTGVWKGFVVVTKEMHRDAKSEELFKEVFLGLLIASSPYLGFASNVFGELRLVSACLPHGVGDVLLSGLGIIDRLALAKGMVKAVSCITQLDLVHCDLKPGNFMLSHDRTVFVIDFGSVSRPGDLPPMSCQHYCPPDTLVSLAFDVFSLGRVFCEVFFTNNSDVPDEVALLIDHMTQDEPRHRPDLQDCLERLVMIEAAVQRFPPGSV